MHDRKLDESIINSPEFISMKKVLKEKYPEEDIDRLINEGNYRKLENMLFTQ